MTEVVWARINCLKERINELLIRIILYIISLIKTNYVWRGSKFSRTFTAQSHFRRIFTTQPFSSDLYHNLRGSDIASISTTVT